MFPYPSFDQMRAIGKDIYRRLFTDAEEVSHDMDAEDVNTEESDVIVDSDEPDEVEEYSKIVRRRISKKLEKPEMIARQDPEQLLDEDFFRASRTGELSERLLNLKSALATIPSSSTDSERVFSVAGRFVTKIRNRLTPRSLDNFTFGNSYFKKIDQINHTGFVYLPFFNIFLIFTQCQLLNYHIELQYLVVILFRFIFYFHGELTRAKLVR